MRLWIGENYSPHADLDERCKERDMTSKMSESSFVRTVNTIAVALLDAPVLGRSSAVA